MLEPFAIIAFAATSDSARARHFYEEMLGLTFISEDEFAIVFSVHEVELRIQKVQRFHPQPHTVLGWSVTDIDVLVRELSARGVAFERYDFLNQDQRGIWKAPSGARIAWFKDPDGNLLSLTEHPRN